VAVEIATKEALMTKHPKWWSVVVLIAISSSGCGDGASGGDCDRICNNACIDGFLPNIPSGDCIRACESSGDAVFNECISYTLSSLECLQTIDCGFSGSLECLDESLEFADCVAP
jgi:hypothetical protein